MKGELKICSKCHQAKNQDKDFYRCGGKLRSECKECTVKRNVTYQRKIQAWKHRYGDEQSRKLHMREYYSKNKDKFAQYRIDFKDKHPNYYKNYHKKKNEKK